MKKILILIFAVLFSFGFGQKKRVLLAQDNLHPYTQRILAKAKTEGFTIPSPVTIKKIDTYLVRRLVKEGVWEKMDGLWFSAYNDIGLMNFSMINWINPQAGLAFHGTGVSMTVQGWKFDGTGGGGSPGSPSTIGAGINTGWNFSLDPIKLSLNNAHYMGLVWDVSDVSSLNDGLITATETNGQCKWSAYSSDAHRINTNSNLSSSVNMSGQGLKIINRVSSTDVVLSNKGTEYARTQSSTGLNTNFLIGANSTTTRSKLGISMASLGAAINDKREIIRQILNEYLYQIGLPANA